MPRVRLLVSLASSDGSYGSGSVIDLSDDEAKRFIEQGMGILLVEEKPVESAIIKPKAEKAISKKHGGV